MRLALIFSCSLLGVQAANAAVESSFKYEIEYRDPKLSDASLSEILKLLEGVNEMAVGLNAPVARLSLEDQQSRFSYSNGTLKVGREYRHKGLWAPFEKAKIAIVHEWGHAIFDEHMQRLSPAWKSLVEKSQDGPSSLLTPEQKALRMIGGSYSEFCADLIATLYFEDLDAMPSSLRHTRVETGETVDHDPKGYRGFSVVKKAKGWRPLGKGKSRVYLALVPTRSHMGQKYLNEANLKGRKAALLKAVLETTAVEFEALAKRAEVRRVQPEEINLRLMSALDQKLKGLAVSR